MDRPRAEDGIARILKLVPENETFGKGHTVCRKRGR